MSTRKQKVAVVTGASKGIGAGVRDYLLEDGWLVFGLSRWAEKSIHKSYIPVVCNVSDETSVKDAFSVISTQTKFLDAVINAAGIYGPIGPTLDVPVEEWLETFKVNTLGPLLIIRNSIDLLKKTKAPSIVNFAGGGAFDPLPRYSAYAVSKSAIVRLTETLAVEFGHGITINAVAPGFVATEIHQATLNAGVEMAGEQFYEHTLRKLEEGAVPIELPVKLVSWLLSPYTRGLTGKTLSANFDPWQSPEFPDLVEMINASPLYTMKRINPVNLEQDDKVLRKMIVGIDNVLEL
ncbi:SDR family NAD(P)-dependent oxidoreductase [Kiloniella laminariae]|uniref:SDR family NAD(P)-dependent oxidoreductase n=1 Tax=Kiloniella laminariae TaxID=454162 RepID=UPI00035CD4E5|nr:SDR family oxidoreductase [Kiloniella laminariae]